MPEVVAHEPADWVYHISSACGIILLVTLFVVGAWIRSFIAPPNPGLAVKYQLIASVPVGLITMSVYARSLFPSLSTSSASLTYDVFFAAGYVVIAGMLSRETLDRLLIRMRDH